MVHVYYNGVALDVHQHKARVCLAVDAAVRARGRAGVDEELFAELKGLKLVRVASDHEIDVKLHRQDQAID